MAFGRNMAFGRIMAFGHNLAFSRNMASGRNKLIELIMAFGLNKLIKLNNIGPTRSIVKSIGLSLFGYFALADL